MTSSDILGDIVITPITMALLDDSGWYLTDKTLADVDRWGFNKGCEFFNNKCSSTSSFKEFCATDNENGCSFGYEGIGMILFMYLKKYIKIIFKFFLKTFRLFSK